MGKKIMVFSQAVLRQVVSHSQKGDRTDRQAPNCDGKIFRKEKKNQQQQPKTKQKNKQNKMTKRRTALMAVGVASSPTHDSNEVSKVRKIK